LGGKFGTNLLTNLQLRLSANGQVSDLSKVDSDYHLALIEPQGTNAIATINGKLAADVVKQTADVEARVGVNLAKLLAVLPQGGLNLKSGQLQLDAKVSQRDPILNAAGTLRVQSLAGVAGNRSFQDLGLSTEYDLSVTNHQQVELRRVLLTLAPTERVPTNAVALAGRLDLSKPTALAGALKLSASALDLTPYYDLYEGLSSSPSQSTTTTTPDAKSPRLHPARKQNPRRWRCGKLVNCGCGRRPLLSTGSNHHGRPWNDANRDQSNHTSALVIGSEQRARQRRSRH
jgi:hypothetical protein